MFNIRLRKQDRGALGYFCIGKFNIAARFWLLYQPHHSHFLRGVLDAKRTFLVGLEFRQIFTEKIFYSRKLKSQLLGHPISMRLTWSILRTSRELGVICLPVVVIWVAVLVSVVVVDVPVCPVVVTTVEDTGSVVVVSSFARQKEILELKRN